MLSAFSRYLLLPILVLVLFVYGALPWWLPIVANVSPFPANIKIDNIEVGYPLFDHWQIQSLEASQESPSQRNQIKIQDLQLTYNLLDLWNGASPDLHISKLSFDSQLAQASVDSAPILLLLPQRWLQQMPKQLTIERVTGQVRSPDLPLGQDFSIIGKLSGSPESAHAVAKIITHKNEDFYFEAQFAANNALSATLFTKQQSAPIAKLTSQMRHLDQQLNWQGQMAVNVPVMQKLLAHLIPPRFALPIDQGRLMSHWQINVPSDQQQSLQQWLKAAHGEHQFQVQVQTESTLASDLVIDANVTHYLSNTGADQWQINAGSQLSLKPNWASLNLQAETIDDFALNNLEMRAVAQGPIAMGLESEPTSFFNDQKTLVLDGVFNATMESPTAQYQIFTQLKDLRYNNTNAWHGRADLSGYYVLPKQHQLLKQIPLGIKQIQALAQLEFTMTPEQWKINLAPNSKLSANQVESQQKNSQVLLFASDRLNLVNSESLQLSYHTANNQWQWNDLNLSLHPQTTTGTAQATSRALGLQIQLPAGRSQFNYRPSEGYYQLHAKDTRLKGWPEFDLLGKGSFNFGGDKLEIDFEGQAQPFTQQLNSHFNWDFANQQGNMQATANDIDLVTLQTENRANWSLQASSGKVDYEGSWQWQAKQPQDNLHLFKLTDVSGISDDFEISTMHGDIRVTSKDKNLQSHYTLDIKKLQPRAYAKSLVVTNANVDFVTDSSISKGLAKAISRPDHWQINKLHGDFLNGDISYQGTSWLINNIGLEHLSKVIWPTIEASGMVKGEAVLDNNWQIQDLHLTNSQPVQLHLNSPVPANHAGADTINLLFNKMQVSKLEIISQGAIKQHTLPMQVRLQGAAANFNKGQAVDLNLTLEANLANLYAP